METYKTTKAILFKLEIQNITKIQKDVEGLQSEFSLTTFVNPQTNTLSGNESFS